MKSMLSVSCLAFATLCVGYPACAQQTATVSLTPPASNYLNLALPSRVTLLMNIHGNRFYKPGKERTILGGTFTDSTGSSGAVLTTQIPGKVKLAIQGAGNKALTFDGVSATAGLATATGADLSVMESLQDDGLEQFFFSYLSAGGRLLGGRFRIDGGNNPNYTGPWYDLYELRQKVAVRPGAPVQQKVYYFDSLTGQLGRVRYHIQRNGEEIDIQTVYSQWSSTGGQLVPGKIERFENGISLFSFVVASAQVGPAVSDGIFTVQAQ